MSPGAESTGRSHSTGVAGRARGYLAATAATCGRAAVVHLIALQVLVAVTEGVGLALLLPIIQSLEGDDSVNLPGTTQQISTTVAVLSVLVVVCLRAAVQWREAVLANDLRSRTTDELRINTLVNLFAARWGFIAAQRRSHVVQSVTTEALRVETALDLLIRLMVGFLTLCATAAVAVLLSPVVGALGVLSLLVVALVARRTVRSSVAMGVELSDSNDVFGAVVTDSLASVRLIRAHDAAAGWHRLIDDAAARGRAARHRYVASSSGVRAVLSVATLLAALGLVLVGRWLGMGVAELVALAVVMSRLLGSAQLLLMLAQTFANTAPALDKLGIFLADVKANREPPPPRTGPSAPADPHAPLLETPSLERTPRGRRLARPRRRRSGGAPWRPDPRPWRERCREKHSARCGAGATSPRGRHIPRRRPSGRGPRGLACPTRLRASTDRARAGHGLGEPGLVRSSRTGTERA